MRDINFKTIAELAEGINSRDISSTELVSHFLDRIQRLNPGANAYITVMEKEARKAAERADTEIKSGKYRGPLHGIPFGIKDNIATRNVRTTAGSKVLADWYPDFDAT